MTDKKALIEQLTTTCHGLDPVDPLRLLVDDVIAALAQPEQEPVAWMYSNTDGECEQIEYGEPFDDPSVTPLYTHPPQRTWVGLTDDEIALIHADNPHPQGFARAILAKSKEKNT